MQRIDRREIEEIRIIDRRLEDGSFQSTCCIKVRGSWFSDTRSPACLGADYTRDEIIEEFLTFREFFDRTN